MIKKQVLVVCAHADDEVLGVGGAIQQHVRNGDHVSVIIVSNRQPIELQLDEKIHARHAQAILGYQNLFMLDFDDMDLDYNIIRFLEPIEELYNKICPDVVYTHHYGDNNQDHRAVAEACDILCRPQSMRPPLEYIQFETPSSTDQAPATIKNIFTPNFFIALSEEYIIKKIEAMKCYQHQVRRYPLSSRSSEGIKITAQYRGQFIQQKFAEAFHIVRKVQL